MAKILHIMIRVLDEARSVAFYKEAFGLEVTERNEFDDFILVYLSNQESAQELELTINKGRTEPYDIGNGYGHLVVSVADVKAEHTRFETAGFAPRKLTELVNKDNAVERFFFVTDPDGYSIAVVQRIGRYL